MERTIGLNNGQKLMLNSATYEKEDYLNRMGVKLTPILGWAERGGASASGHGNSVPRFHITWGTGPGLVEPFSNYVLQQEQEGRVTFLPRHQVTSIDIEDNQVRHISGNILEDSDVERGAPSSRQVIDTFSYDVEHLVITSGGIGANIELIKKYWPKRLGQAPGTYDSSVPDSTDGRLIGISENAGVNIVNKDRMWHYTEGVKTIVQFGLNMGFVSFLVLHQCGLMLKDIVCLHQIILVLILYTRWKLL